MEFHASSEFGFKDSFRIAIGSCCSELDIAHAYPFMTNSGAWSWISGVMIAHTHYCPKDPWYQTICIQDEKHVTNSDGSPSEILMHEYAHVLDSRGLEKTWLKYLDKCSAIGNPIAHSFSWQIPEENSAQLKRLQDFLNHEGHGESWKKIMISLGLAPNRFYL